MTQSARPARGKARPAKPGPRAADPASPSRFRGKAWLLFVVPLGLTTWASFVYIGLRARRPRWLVWAVVYAALVVGYLALDSSSAHPSNSVEGVAAVLALLAWIGGGAHAIAISDDAVRRIDAMDDPKVTAARSRIERRAEGRHLLATQPRLARELGLGRPDLTGADDYGLVDVNHCPAASIATLPGFSADLARQIVEKRAECGGFSSAEDLGLVADLPPAVVDGIRDTAVFIPD